MLMDFYDNIILQLLFCFLRCWNGFLVLKEAITFKNYRVTE